MQIPEWAVGKFIMGSHNPYIFGSYYKVAGAAGLLIYMWVRFRMGLPDYMTKQKSEWVKLDNVTMHRYGFTMDPKTKAKALRKLEKEELIELHLISNSGKAPQVRLIVK
jgi:hypothetical protein